MLSSIASVSLGILFVAIAGTKNRVEVRKTMLSDQLLDAEKFSTVSFRSTSLRAKFIRARPS